MADRRYHVASLLIGVVVWTGENDTKTISVDADLFENGAKLFVRKRNSVDRALFTLSIQDRDSRLAGGARLLTK